MKNVLLLKHLNFRFELWTSMFTPDHDIWQHAILKISEVYRNIQQRYNNGGWSSEEYKLRTLQIMRWSGLLAA
jgi:hypothetical protein